MYHSGFVSILVDHASLPQLKTFHVFSTEGGAFGPELC